MKSIDDANTLFLFTQSVF